MGNRAVIALDTYSPESKGIYLHWNGGRDSIEGFLEFTRRNQPWIRETGLVKLILGIEYFGVSAHEIKPEPCSRLDCDNWDNGVYVVDTNTWQITGRHHMKGAEQQEYPLEDFVQSVEEAYAKHSGLTGVSRYLIRNGSSDQALPFFIGHN